MKNKNNDKKVINDVYKNARIAMQSINDLLPGVKGKDMIKELKAEYAEYDSFTHDISAYMKRKGYVRKDNNFFKKAMMWGAIKMKTVGGATDTKAAEMMIQGSTMGVVSLIEKRNDKSLELDRETCEYIDKLTEMEGRFEERLKKFL